jgi:hypothetical protein
VNEAFLHKSLPIHYEATLRHADGHNVLELSPSFREVEKQEMRSLDTSIVRVTVRSSTARIIILPALYRRNGQLRSFAFHKRRSGHKHSTWRVLLETPQRRSLVDMVKNICLLRSQVFNALSAQIVVLRVVTSYSPVGGY